MNASQTKYAQLTTRPVDRLVCGLAVPSMVSMMVTGIYNLADTFFVGKIDTQSTAALGVVFAYMAAVQAIAFFFGQGSGIFISKALGARQTDSATSMAAGGLFSAMLLSAMIALLSLCFMEPVLFFLGSTPTVLPEAKAYFRFILMGTPFTTATFVLNNQMRYQGNAMLSMIGILSGALLNILLDPILIFTCHMNVSGAGAATAISQAVSFLLMYRLSSKAGGIRPSWCHFRPCRTLYADISAYGLPSLTRQILMSVSAICLNHAVGVYGDEALAAFSVVNRIMMLANFILLGFGQGFQPVCGFNFGAGLWHRVRQALRFSIVVATVYCVVYALIGWIWAEPIVRCFRSEDAEVVRIGTQIIRCYCIAYPTVGSVILFNMYLQNIGETGKAVLTALARHGLFFIPVLFIGAACWGLQGIMWTQPLADVLSFFLAVPLGLSALRRMMQRSS